MKSARALASSLAFMALYLLHALAAANSSATPLLQGLAPAAASNFVEVVATADVLRQLSSGGYTLYLRHGNTNNAIPDRMPAVDLNDCSTQRPLTEEGRLLMVKIGGYMRKADIPIGEFKVSPMCRALQSAAAAFPMRSPVVDNKLMYVANLTDAEKAPVIANTRKLLASPVAPGTKGLVLAHAPNLMELIGYFPKEGTLVIFHPKGEKEGFDYIASIPPASWDELLRQSRK